MSRVKKTGLFCMNGRISRQFWRLRLPKMGVPQNHPFSYGIFHEIYQPSSSWGWWWKAAGKAGAFPQWKMATALWRRGGEGGQNLDLWSLILKLATSELVSLRSGWWFGTFGLFFPSYWECHHPNWRTPSFFRGVQTTNQMIIYPII